MGTTEGSSQTKSGPEVESELHRVRSPTAHLVLPLLSGVAIAAHQQHVLIYEGDGKQAEDNMHTNITSRLGLGPSCHYLCKFLIHFANCCQ